MGYDRHHAPWYVMRSGEAPRGTRVRRRAAKVDANQPAIVRELRDVPGVTVRSLAAVGDGMADLIVGFGGRNWLLEVKDPTKPPSKRELTPDQVTFFETWTGQVAKIETSAEALQVMGIVT